MRISEEDVQQQPLPQELDPNEEAKTKAEEKEPDAKTKKRWAEFQQRLTITKAYRKKLISNWSVNIDYRRGKPFASQNDSDNISVNLDWSYTKTKQAALFSQIPKARVNHSPETVTVPWISAFERDLNDKLVVGGIEATMDETLPDCINAAGIGVALVAMESLTELKEVPSIDMAIFPPEIQAQAMQTGMLFGEPIPMEKVPQPVDTRYTVRRISPADFLWPTDFTGSDFDNAPWLGYSGRLTWTEAMSRFNLTEEDKEQVLSEERTTEDKLSNDYDKEKVPDDGKVGFDEIFYNSYQFDADAKSFTAIHHLVFLHGRTKPVIDEPWKGQQPDPQQPGKFLGSSKKPLRVLTLAYVTDEDIPPSDSAIARSQVNELNKGRTHINKQRQRNAPWTWFDVNRLDPAIQHALMRGTWQHAVPVQGDGSRVIGTVQQPAMHQENFLFDKIAKQDSQDLWGLGGNQVGVGGDVETKGEANIIQNNFMTKVGRERARVASFFCGIAEVLGALMCLYEDPTKYGDGFDQHLADKLNYSILADSTVLVDSKQRLEQINEFVDKYAKSGFINIEPVLREVAMLIGLDPATTIKAPQPQSPPPPNISLRLTGGDDMMNPLLLAFMIKSGDAPDEKLIEKAKELIQQSVIAPDHNTPDMGAAPPGPPTNVGEANPNMSILPTIGKRSEGGEGGPV